MKIKEESFFFFFSVTGKYYLREKVIQNTKNNKREKMGIRALCPTQKAITQ